MRQRYPRIVRRVSWAAGLVVLITAPAAGQQAAPDSIPPGAPVVFQGDTLFALHARIGAFTPAERATGAAVRLDRVYHTVGLGADSVVVVQGETTSDIVIGQTVILSVADGDTVGTGSSRQQLAIRYAAALTTEFRAVIARTSITSIAWGALYSVLATLVLLLALSLMRRGVGRLTAMIEAGRRSRIPSVRIQRFEILSADRISDVLISTVRTARTILIILLLYFYVPLVLSFFPWTAPMSRRIIGYVATPLARTGEAILGYVPNLLSIVVIVFVTRYLLKFIHLFFDAVDKRSVVLPSFEREWSQPTYKIVRFLVLAFVVVVIFPYLPGARSDAFKGVSIFLGALITLGSSSAIANMVAGTVLTYTRAFRVGDRIQLGSTVGDVIEQSLLVTRVRTIKNEEITIPNAQVLSGHIINYSTSTSHGGLILHTSVTIGYDAPWRQVHELLIAAARATSHVLETPAPFVLQTSLDDFYVSYQINAYTDNPAVMAVTYSELHQHIQDAFNAAGVEIMSPHYGALRDGNAIALPPDALPPGYVAPPFRVGRDAGS